MPIPEYLHALIADYQDLTARDPGSLTVDEARSIRYFRTEQFIAAGITPPAGTSRKLLRWVTSARAVDDVIASAGRLPRENNRVSRAEVLTEERAVVEWLRYQRRYVTRDTHCDYQRRRLQAFPGFMWDPIADRWSDTLRASEQFLDQHRRAPSVRSSDPIERSLAAWSSKQRHLRRRRGRLDPERETTLAALPIWTWGAR